jgi:copper(I)-binding protein
MTRHLGLAACMASTLLLAAALGAGLTLVRPAFAEAAATRVSGAWVRLPAAAGRPAAGYFEAVAPAGDRLVAAASPKAGRVEMHSMTMKDGVMRMQAERTFAVPASGRLSFAPGGNHLMLFDLDPTLRAGDRIPVALTFEKAGTVTVMADLRPANQTKPEGSPHQH